MSGIQGGTAAGTASGAADGTASGAATRAGTGVRVTARERLIDVVLAVFVGALVAGTAAFDTDTTIADYALIAVASAVLALYRTAPRAVLAVVTASGAAYVLHAHPGPPAALPVIAASHVAARVGHRAWAATAGGVFLVAYLVTGPTTRQIVEQAALLMGWFLCAVVT
ncbi:MAG: hypothetical protein HOV73_21640, partial [Streptomyces sp.]|nr:hypothetical protein [Streptomyces sp.]NUR42688.1 hypothetical protein [Streptomyces sp.]